MVVAVIGFTSGLASPQSQAAPPAEAPPTYQVGLAKEDITPDYPIRLNGFGFRRTESEGVTLPIWAKALAISRPNEPAVVLIAVDNLGVPDELVQQLAERLSKNAGLERQRLAVTATHTHTAPMLTGANETLFSLPIPAEHQEHIRRYTGEFLDKLEKVALAALADQQPAQLNWGIGSVTFATNRRTPGGPVDHDLPLLVVKNPAGKLRGIYVSYACHCVTLSNNRISGDWAGFAQEAIERQYPGVIALTSVGCGADSNPSSGVTGDKRDAAATQGAEIAAEVKRLIDGPLTPLTGPVTVRSQRIDLPFDTPRTQAEWQQRVAQGGAVGYQAQVTLARLARGDKLPEAVSYPIQSWAFGDFLAMVFLPGEVVVDYSLRLKRELDGTRLWVNAYANAAPCYIPSERVLKEGGYEGGDAMIYYDQPQRFRPGLEQQIVDVLHAQLDKPFKSPFNPNGTQGVVPLGPQRAVASLRVRDDMTVELVANEPLVIDPVAIDFGPDGRMWVAEMHDYPAGRQGDFQPGGRVRVLSDSDGDGRYDQSTVFLDDIPFPTGVTVWRSGVLVCAAPDILYAEDTDGDGRADVVRKLFSGFATHNYQGRVNSLVYGLDGWVYGACGLFGGEIKSFARDEPYQLGERDFRIDPDRGLLEPVTGQTQQGRARNDWGDWFGCDSGTLVRHYPLVEHYLRRNPHVAAPAAARYVPAGEAAGRLLPISNPVLFELSGTADRATAACGLGVYRDELLGPQYTGDTFTCEPVANLVHHLHLEPAGATFSGRRPAAEVNREFLASTDSWFRPVQALTGPDGALWIVDMYRYVIEHPRWIPPATLSTLDARAGDTMGRIYRIYPTASQPRPIARLDQLDAAGLVAAMDSPNGWQRDMASQLLVWNKQTPAVPHLKQLALGGQRPAARMQALCTLDQLGALDAPLLRSALADKSAGVRRHAVRLAEPLVTQNPALQDALLALVDDRDPQVLMQLACSLGQWPDRRAAAALGRLAIRQSQDEYQLAAVLSSVDGQSIDPVLAAAMARTPAAAAQDALTLKLLALAAATADDAALTALFDKIIAGGPADQTFTTFQMTAASSMLAAGNGRLEKLTTPATSERLERMFTHARRVAGDEQAADADRLAMIDILGRRRQATTADSAALALLLTPQTPAALQLAAVDALGRQGGVKTAALLLAEWNSYSPAVRSQVLDVLLSRPDTTVALVDSIEGGTILPADLDASRRQQMGEIPNEVQRARVIKLLALGVDADRQRVLESYQNVVTLPADAARGKALYAKRCAVCHRLDGVGEAIGPDLAALGNREPAALLMSVLDPNRNVDPRYTTYVAATKDGRTFSGILASDAGSSITLKAQEGKQQVLLRGDIEALRSTGKSLMPEGMEKDLSPQDLADVLAYLSGAATPKQLVGNTPQPVSPREDGALALLATVCEVYGGEITLEPHHKNLGFWHSAHDRAVWTVELDQAGRYDVYLDGACDDAAAGSAFVLDGDREALRGKIAGTGGWQKYRQEKLGSIELRAGRQRLTFRADGKLTTTALVDLRGLWLVPTGMPLPNAASGP